ncbi:glycyl-radical enzyme activating protein [Streptococcus merionis]|uniref:Glycyl-radical enzyme activating protein family protein n=1 Tax=Streptococcus merionis TaxID=400065 RepID=A0A239SSI7_9STRE|nr:glycyl-radical enzyme activating protein [Streptococcus merionis]SNU87603.1 glycyl-radical enzyme activating protein family protein [Streptococcus merionis]
MKDEGLVFNIQRYSVHDGGGIRTIIFLKGCPLACPWCANPESRKVVKPAFWIKNGKKEIIGEWRKIDDLVNEVMRDEIFFRTSGGGVTISGGEVLMQADFAGNLLKEFYRLGVHTAIETTGAFPLDCVEKLTPYLNQVLFDLKIMDSNRASEVIGINVNNVKKNLEFLLTQKHIEVIPRVPLIPGYTTSTQNLEAIANYLKSLSIKEVHLLPFHQYGSSKYEYLGWNYTMKDVPTLTSTEIDNIKKIFEDKEVQTNIGGL